MPWGGGPPCPKCNKTVYQAEEIACAGSKWHKLCFFCDVCKKPLDSFTVAEHEGSIFCKSCHGKKFGLKGYGYGVGAGTLSMDTGVAGEIVSTAPATSVNLGTTGPGEPCGMCQRPVYAAEKLVSAGKAWHKECFVCTTCKKSLDSNVCREHEGYLFCQSCYGNYHGPKGFGFGLGAGALTHTQKY